MRDNHIFTVSGLTLAIRERLESAFPLVWVRGQTANVSRPASGHVYFTLRDEESSLAAVWFKGSQKSAERFDPLTGEVYEGGPRESLALNLENGMEVVCAGRLAVYAPRGQYQLVVEFAQDAGLGRLHEEFERLKNKLAGLGYFGRERKRPLPPHPGRVALLTSPRGAAIHDFLRLAEKRGLSSAVRVYPVPVQGEAAPAKIIEAMRRVAAEGWAEALVLIRGGGSLEDLWAFNNPDLARTIFEFPVPVLAGIGHEVDVTLADMTADVRAATPSHAAQLLWPERAELAARLRAASEALFQAGDRCLEREDRRLEHLVRSVSMLSPARRVAQRRERLDSAVRLLGHAGRFVLDREYAALARLAAGLESGPAALPARARLLEHHDERLRAAMGRVLREAEHGLERDFLRLAALDPFAPLERGYALARKADGSFVRKKDDALPGESLRLMVRDGDIAVRVEGE